MRWCASRLYSRTVLGGAVRRFASRYICHPGNGARFGMRLHRRRAYALQIFIFHNVNDAGNSFFESMPVSQFRMQMEYLARNFQVVSMDQIADGDFPTGEGKCHVAVTFDDGYRDNFLHAFPILKQLGIPATIFLAAGSIESGEMPWYDKVRLAFMLTPLVRGSFADLGGPEFVLDSERVRVAAVRQVLAWLRQAGDATRLQALQQLYDLLRVPPTLNLPGTMLNWDEIREMRANGISFGAHTITHPVLAALPVERQEEEIVGSKKLIEARLQARVRHFAYPFGKPGDIGPEAKRIVRQAGYETAVTTVYGTNDPQQDPFELKRFCLLEGDPGIFGLKVDWNRMYDNPRTSSAMREHEAI